MSAIDSTAQPPRRASTTMVRESNARTITAVLRQHGPLTRADLGRLSGLARPTVMTIIDGLLDDQYVVETGTRQAVGGDKGGRPASLLDLNYRRNGVVVCTIREVPRISVHDAAGQCRYAARVPTSARSSRLLPTLATHIRRAVDAASDIGPLGAVSVLAPGLINRRTGACISFPPFGWNNLPIRAGLERALEVPVTVLNPAAAAMLGEVCTGTARGHDDGILVFLDYGIGVGVLTDSRLLTGADGAVGELGHCRVAGSTMRCACGRIGCLETVASGREILEQVRTALGCDLPATTTLADLEALRDKPIDDILARAADELASATAWLVNVLNPGIVALGGTPFAAAATTFHRRFAEHVRAESISANAERIQFAEADPQADLNGAVHAGVEKLPDWLGLHCRHVD